MAVKDKWGVRKLGCVFALCVGFVMTLIQAGKYYELTGNGGGYWVLVSLLLFGLSGYFLSYLRLEPKIKELTDLNLSLEKDLDSVKDHMLEVSDMYDKKTQDTINYYEGEINNLLSSVEKLSSGKKVAPSTTVSQSKSGGGKKKEPIAQ